MKHVEWRKVTWYSQIAAIILALILLGLGFWAGRQYQQIKALEIPQDY